jgi:hypothetical protein
MIKLDSFLRSCSNNKYWYHHIARAKFLSTLSAIFMILLSAIVAQGNEQDIDLSPSLIHVQILAPLIKPQTGYTCEGAGFPIKYDTSSERLEFYGEIYTLKPSQISGHLPGLETLTIENTSSGINRVFTFLPQSSHGSYLLSSQFIFTELENRPGAPKQEAPKQEFLIYCP